MEMFLRKPHTPQFPSARAKTPRGMLTAFSSAGEPIFRGNRKEELINVDHCHPSARGAEAVLNVCVNRALLALREGGHYTIAQDESTSAVYGMPKAAAQLQAAREILALDKIGPRLANLLAATEKVHG